MPSQAWETENEFPQLWGTRRIGPDLARESGKRTRDWHLTHLWNPRWVVPESNMPPHPWLFDGSPLQPTSEALDLVAYLDSLGRDARLAGTLTAASSGKIDPAEEKRMGIFCDCAIPRTPGSAVLFSTDLPPDELARFELHGAAVFARNCSGCHGPGGKGDGPAALSLLPAPRDLARVQFSDQALSRVLWQGVPGSSMPGWHDLPANDLRGLLAYVRSLKADRSVKKVLLSADELAKAKQIFVTNCAMCHGSQGKGDGTTAASLAPRPTNFWQVRPSLSYAEEVLAGGVPGTAMPPWSTKLDAGQRTMLAHYVRTMYQPVAP
jgi:mono/diheme cytochrome c family protein